MENRWSDRDAERFLSRYAKTWGEDMALRTYTSRLLGAEPRLVLHGGGNTSVKGVHTNLLGERLPALFVKASGYDMAAIEPEGHPGLDLEYLRRLRKLTGLDDLRMENELRTHLFDARAPTPSIETLVHAFMPAKFIDHTHAGAVLALTNQDRGEEIVRDALGDDVLVLDYVSPGFKLAAMTADALEAAPGKRAMVWMRHGVVTWGETAREAYDSMIELVSNAEAYVAKRASRGLKVAGTTDLALATRRWARVAPILRGLLARPGEEGDQAPERVILAPLITDEILRFVDAENGRELALSPPLTADHLIRTKSYPLWINAPDYDDENRLREQLRAAISDYAAKYEAYLQRHSRRHSQKLERGLRQFDPLPRVVLLPGMGCGCAGPDIHAASIARDITLHTVETKVKIAAMGIPRGLSEEQLFDMEYRSFQHAKLGRRTAPPLGRQVALVTGAAGAIGSGITRSLLGAGCHVAVTDLPGENLEKFTGELASEFGSRVAGVALDVTDPQSVRKAFEEIIFTWGGVDLVVANAGSALVSSLSEMDLEDFRRLQRINVEGTLLLLAEAARHFETQGTGGDVVLISTKNVFAPGARFGAYSATKAAAHQLARIASLELAEIGVRVNMVAPDAIFAEGERKSGLWEEVGPDRMRARGLNQEQLEEYYRNRNLLKVRITATHVANAVLFFATRQTPTTGATLPVDGGLPDATPR